MSNTTLSSVIFGAIVLCLAGCEPDDGPPLGPPDTMIDQDPSQPDRDAGKDPGREADAGGRGDGDGSSDDDPDDAGARDGSPADASAPSDAAQIDAGADYSPCPGGGAACKILPLGDSITFGLGYSGGYRVELFRKALSANQNITFLGSQENGPSTVDGSSFPGNNEGHSGWTIQQIASLVPDPALDDKPDIVLLMAGTNDVNLSQDLANAPARLGALIDAITSADTHTLVVVAQLTPLGASLFGSSRDAAVQTFNAGLPALVSSRAAQGKHVMLVDMHTGFPDSGLGDGVHPNQEGYEWMAEVWYQAMGPLLR